MPKQVSAKQQKNREEKYPSLVVACKMREGKKQHLTPGKCYRVTDESAKLMIKNGQAVKATAKQEEGGIYTVPNSKKDKPEETE